MLAGRQIIKDGRGSNRSTTDGDKLTQTASLENLAEPSVLVNPEKRQTRGWSNRDGLRAATGRTKLTNIFTLAGMDTRRHPMSGQSRPSTVVGVNRRSRPRQGNLVQLGSSACPARRCDAGNDQSA
ncbi:hypothetical protein ELS24_18400 [Achromobacter spanius]|nr:hypothetical protein ELS24_18400 [Achromobacter spanius]